MQKMQKIGIIVISVFLIGLIIFVALYDSVIDKTILKINGEKYTVEDFNNFANLVELDQGQEMDLKELYEEYVNRKLYCQKALDFGITLTEEELKTIDEHYESAEVNKETLAQLGFTKEVYVEYLKQATLATKFSNMAPDMYPITDEQYVEYKKELADQLEMYNYRILEVYNEVPEESEDKTITEEIKQATKAKIEGALDRIKNGEDFETVANEYDPTGLSQLIEGYSVGQVRSVPKMLLADTLQNEVLYSELLKLEAGNYTNIIETSNGYIVARLESVEPELNEEYDEAFRNALNAENAQQHILGTTEIIRNTGKIKNVKHVDFSTIPVNEVETENETPNITIEEVGNGESSEEVTENTEGETTVE